MMFCALPAAEGSEAPRNGGGHPFHNKTCQVDKTIQPIQNYRYASMLSG